MNKLLGLYSQLEKDGIAVFDYPVEIADASTIYLNKRYAIFIDINQYQTAAEEFSALAHEYGHCATGATHSVCSSLDLIEKHEYKADKRAAHEFLKPDELQEAVEEGYTEPWELAEQFGVTEDFLRRAVYIYQCEGLID